MDTNRIKEIIRKEGEVYTKEKYISLYKDADTFGKNWPEYETIFNKYLPNKFIVLNSEDYRDEKIDNWYDNNINNSNFLEEVDESCTGFKDYPSNIYSNLVLRVNNIKDIIILNNYCNDSFAHSFYDLILPI